MATARFSAKNTATTTKDQVPPRQLTCFVVAGFGNKADYATGRVLNLDKTFELLVQPACDVVNVNAFRAIDVNQAGSIDMSTFPWSYEADIVIADLSTLNANVIYGLGVRHALKPNTTIVIAESDLIRRIPFDLGTFVVLKYEHAGETIAETEQARFVSLLSGVIRKIIDAERMRQQQTPQLARMTDSPVFTYLSDLKPASYVRKVSLLPPAWVPPEQRLKKGEDTGGSLASLIHRAEAAKKTGRFAEAVAGFRLAIERQTGGSDTIKPDISLVQRLALVTYKNGEGKGADGKQDKAAAVVALREAWSILSRHCEPATSNDPETLGLAGAIHKRQFDWLGDLNDLNLSIRFYERAFYVKRDYYNGINVAFLYTLRSTLVDDRFSAIVDFGHANMLRRQVVEICSELMNDTAAFHARGDKGWVTLVLAEAYQGLGDVHSMDRMAPLIASTLGRFNQEVYQQQWSRLQQLIDKFNLRVRPESLVAVLAPSVAETAPYLKPTPVSELSHKPPAVGMSELLVSYASGPESNTVVDKLEALFRDSGLRMLRDRREIRYKDSIGQFMQRIATGRCVVVVISKKYLESEYCMTELVGMLKAEDLRERIFPIVLEDAQIYRASACVDYVEHWERESAALDASLKRVRGDNLVKLQAKLTAFTEYRRLFDDVSDTLRDMNALTPEEHAATGYAELLAAVRQQLGMR